MAPFYSRTGDDGTTGQLGEGRLPKYHPRIEALGVIDESSAALGLARALCQGTQIISVLTAVQRDLYSMMAEIAATPENAEHFRTLDTPRLNWLESQVDHFSKTVSIPGDFILPGDTLSGAALDMARTIIRRAERCVAKLLDTGEINNGIILQYLNRLSSLCFVLELHENRSAGKDPTLAKK